MPHLRQTLGTLALTAALTFTIAPTPLAAQEATLQSGTQLMQQGRHDEAAEVFRAIAERDGNAVAWYRLGMSLQEGGHPEEAIEPLERAIELGFQAPFARLRIARARAKLGDDDAALDILEQAVDEGMNQPPLLGHLDFQGIMGSDRFAAIRDSVARLADPCGTIDVYRAFDFWVGEWDVFNPGGAQIGQNRIEPLLGGCAIMENWTDAQGNQGKSINTFDRTTGLWRQLWVSDRGVVTDYNIGTVDEGRIDFRVGTVNAAGDTVVTQRMVFTPVAADTVTQEIFSTSDNGESWASSWLGTYVRKSGTGAGGN